MSAAAATTTARRGPGSVNVTSSVVEVGGRVAAPAPPTTTQAPAPPSQADARVEALVPAPLFWTSDATSAAAARMERLRLLQRKLDTLASGRLPDAAAGSSAVPRLTPPPVFAAGTTALPPDTPAPLMARMNLPGDALNAAATQNDALLDDLTGRISRLEGLFPPTDAASSADTTAAKLVKTFLDPPRNSGANEPHADASFPYATVVRSLRDAMLLVLEPRICGEHSARLRLATTQLLAMDAKPLVGTAAGGAGGGADSADAGLVDVDARHVGTRLPRAMTAQREAQWAQLGATTRKMESLALALAMETRPLAERAAALDGIILAAARNAAAAEADVQAHEVSRRAVAACHARLDALRAQCARNDETMRATIGRVATGLMQSA